MENEEYLETYSYKEAQSALAELTSKIEQRYQRGDPVEFDLDGRPSIKVTSFEPIRYEQYGTFRNRAPKLVGTFAVRSLFMATSGDSVAGIFCCFDASERDTYGILLRTRPSHKEFLNILAENAGSDLTVF